MSVLHERAHGRLIHRLLSMHHRSRDSLKGKKRSIGAGIAGEERVLDYLKKLSTPWPVLWDVNLKIAPGHFFQIDVLVLTPAGAVIYEAKNIAGRLRFETGPARLDKVDPAGEVTDRYDCPMLQLQDEMANLRIWLYQQDIPCAVDGAVVMTGSGLIEKPPGYGNLFSLRELRMDILGRGKPETWTVEELWELARYIMEHNEPYMPFPLLDRVDVKWDEVYWGPICEACFDRLFRKSKRLWSCRGCSRETDDPYTRTFEDWFMLRSRTITNAQVQKLFGLSSSAASQLLSKYPFERKGSGRYTYYEWDCRQPLVRLLLAKGKVETKDG